MIALAGTTATAGLAATGNDKVVVVGPFSGRHASVGEAMRARARVAAKGLELRFEDDACSSEGAQITAQRIAADRPAIVIGHPCSSAAITAAAIYAKAGIPFIATGARHPALTDARAGPLVFRLAGRDDRQGDAASRALTAAAGAGARFALLHDRTASMRALAERTETVLNSDGISGSLRVKQFPFVASEFDYTSLATRVAAFLDAPDLEANGKGILIAAFPQEAMLIIRALRAQNVRVPIVGSEALADANVGKGTSWAQLSVLAPLDRDLSEAAGLYTVAALGMWKEALRSDPVNPSAALATVTIRMEEIGMVSFAANGDANMPSFSLTSWKEGRWRRVQSRWQPIKAASEDGHQNEGRP